MGRRMLNRQTALRDGYSGLHSWLSQVESLWESQKKRGIKEDVYQWLDYQRKLTSQYPAGYSFVLCGNAGTHVASCVVDARQMPSEVSGLSVQGFVADIGSYFYQTTRFDEANYICACLNSKYVDETIKPYQPKGAWGERQIARLPLEAVPIPKFNSKDEKHLRLAELSEKCHHKVAHLALKGESIGFLRNKVREHLSHELEEIDRLVKDILS